MRENDFLGWLYRHDFGGRTGEIPIGDDMGAVLMRSSGADRPALALLKIDQALDRVHFDLRHHSPRSAGQKAVNRCLSDCAAMACRPLALLISVALPAAFTLAHAQDLFEGCRFAATVFECPIIGGDTAIWDQRLAITVAALGQAGDRPVLRAGARPGDVLCVTGPLGGSILGRHMTFVPRIALAEKLVALAPISAMMDLSDGLAADLPRLCAASGVGAVVHEDDIPIHTDARLLAANQGDAGGDSRDAAWHALVDGEDYELLFTVGPDGFSRLRADPDVAANVFAVGTILAGSGVTLLGADSNEKAWPAGFQHIGAPATPPGGGDGP